MAPRDEERERTKVVKEKARKDWGTEEMNEMEGT